MRSADEIQNLIIGIAKSDERVRAVLLNGSRANPNIAPDHFQDFDIVFIVRDFADFITNHDWTNCFGEKLIEQLPDVMSLGKIKKNGLDDTIFHYLMLFKDGNRIDLTLFDIEHFENHYVPDSLSLVWLDKDDLFSKLPTPSDSDYHIRKPTQEMFTETCNEFWWVSTYVAKGLMRNEITYAKEMLESTVRPMFMKIVEWHIGTDNNFSVAFGKGGRFMKQYLSPIQYNKILSTYADQHLENNWKSLCLMAELFSGFAASVAKKLNLKYNFKEQLNAITYLKGSFEEQY